MNLYVKKVLKGGSIIATTDSTVITLGDHKIRRFKGTVVQVPSLRYLVNEQAPEMLDYVDSYLESLTQGDVIDWAVPTEDAVVISQDRDGNSIEPRKLNRVYGDFDGDALWAAIDSHVNPAPKAKKPATAKAGK